MGFSDWWNTFDQFVRQPKVQNFGMNMSNAYWPKNPITAAFQPSIKGEASRAGIEESKQKQITMSNALDSDLHGLVSSPNVAGIKVTKPDGTTVDIKSNAYDWNKGETMRMQQAAANPYPTKTAAQATPASSTGGGSLSVSNALQQHGLGAFTGVVGDATKTAADAAKGTVEPSMATIQGIGGSEAVDRVSAVAPEATQSVSLRPTFSQAVMDPTVGSTSNAGSVGPDQRTLLAQARANNWSRGMSTTYGLSPEEVVAARKQGESEAAAPYINNYHLQQSRHIAQQTRNESRRIPTPVKMPDGSSMIVDFTPSEFVNYQTHMEANETRKATQDIASSLRKSQADAADALASERRVKADLEKEKLDILKKKGHLPYDEFVKSLTVREAYVMGFSNVAANERASGKLDNTRLQEALKFREGIIRRENPLGMPKRMSAAEAKADAEMAKYYPDVAKAMQQTPGTVMGDQIDQALKGQPNGVYDVGGKKYRWKDGVKTPL